MNRIRLLSLLVCLALGVSACGGDDDAPLDGGVADSASDTSAQDSSTADSGSRDGGTQDSGSEDSGAEDGGTEDGGAEWMPPESRGRFVVSHYAGDYELSQYGNTDLEAQGEFLPDGPTGGLIALPELNAVGLLREGADVLNVLNEDLEPMTGSPYTTANLPVDLAHDSVRDRLYVYCIGTEGNPSESLLTVFDTSAMPFTEVEGSPFDIDVAATSIEVDPITGNLFGISLRSAWAGNVNGDGFTHLSGSPLTLDGQGASMAIDPSRGRVYLAETRFPGPQRVYARTTDFEAAEMVEVDTETLGDMVVHLGTGNLYLVGYGSAELYALSGEPLGVLDSCGGGCSILTTETGLGIDEASNRLYIAHVPSVEDPAEGRGRVSVWDISTPATPSEITDSETRIRVETYPNRIVAF